MGIKEANERIEKAKTKELSMLHSFESNAKANSRYINESAQRLAVYDKVLSIIEDECPEVLEEVKENE